MGTNSPEPGSMGRNAQLLLLRLRRVDFLQLVLSLPQQSAWVGLESERLLLDVTLSCDVGGLPAGGDHQRSAYALARAAFRTLRCRERGDCVSRSLHHPRSTGA